ncbi:MAG TPA: ABC transporter substrate-binding protein [Gammaproteobacteria bacterium]|mgnify:CR=1 FL=1|nr:ABC transporter substrate-binding protein [Gammaproteobacteria bacterium]
MSQPFRPAHRWTVFIRSCALLLCGALANAAVAADAPAPTAVVEKLHGTLLTMMKDAATLGYEGRVNMVAPVLDGTFDFETIGRVVTGRYWKDFIADTRDRFVATFARLSAATYADNFDGYAGETFETLSEEVKKGAALVKTRIVKRDGKPVSLNYVLNQRDGEWRIVNVIADGVSDLALKRSEYGAVIAKEGIDALIAKLNAKIASYAAAKT